MQSLSNSNDNKATLLYPIPVAQLVIIVREPRMPPFAATVVTTKPSRHRRHVTYATPVITVTILSMWLSSMRHLFARRVTIVPLVRGSAVNTHVLSEHLIILQVCELYFQNCSVNYTLWVDWLKDHCLKSVPSFYLFLHLPTNLTIVCYFLSVQDTLFIFSIDIL